MTPDKVKEQLVIAVDKAIEEGQWDASLFLKNILKQLQELRAYITQELDRSKELPFAENTVPQLWQKISQERPGYRHVFITVYQSESNNLDRWLNALKLLASHSVSRPVYNSEQDVKNMLREKQNKSDAYVIVWVKESDILLPVECTPLKDRWNHPLLTLKEGSFKLENVISFVHDHQHYHVTEQRLVLIPDP